MINSYYKLPLDTQKFVKNQDVEKCTIKQSIANFIHLITTTYFGECSFDESFGCSIWDVDFDNLTSTNKLRNSISESLYDSVFSKEKRLSRLEIDVEIQQEEFKKRDELNRIKKRVDIRVSGTIKQTNESFSCLESFYIAPLSY